jgi:hypothetical protein
VRLRSSKEAPMDTNEATKQSLELLVRMTKDMSMVVTVQLIAAILMIAVEACLLWAIIKLARYMGSLIDKIRYLTVKVEVMLENMGWETTEAFVRKTADGSDVDTAKRDALKEAEERAALEPLEDKR